uniref:Uncharacterized protein n=1 Tax=mine drainage metagenome TaxID=410659 RepID=E6Q8X7_9ZZZZ
MDGSCYAGPASARASLPTTTQTVAGGPVGPRFVVWAKTVDFVDKPECQYDYGDFFRSVFAIGANPRTAPQHYSFFSVAHCFQC